MTGPASAEPRDLGTFPSRTLVPGTELVRVHRRPPWHYSRDGSGRYDHRGIGTCYTAETPLGALLENARGVTLLSPEFVAQRTVTRVEIAGTLVVADALEPSAYAHGFSLAVSAGLDYSLGERWAHALVEQGFDGIRYLVRHDVMAREVAVALFGVDKVRVALETGLATSAPLDEKIIALGHPYGIRSMSILPGGACSPGAEALEA